MDFGCMIGSRKVFFYEVLHLPLILFVRGFRMSSNRYIPAAICLLMVAAECGSAQVYVRPVRPYGYGGYRGYGGYGYAPYGGTPFGSMAAGMGAMIRSQGAYNQMTAQAATELEQAKSLALDNRLKAAQTQYQLQRLNQQNRADQERQRLAARVDYTPPAPRRLSASQLDPVTGQITWPAVFQSPAFLPERDQMAAQFAARANNPASVSPAQVGSLTLALQNKLDAMHDQLPTGDFFEARHFLEALYNEVRYSGFESSQASSMP